MKNKIIATVLSTVAIFLWGFLSWSALPWHNAQFRSFKNEAQILQAVQQETEKGVYMIPGLTRADGSHLSEEDWSAASMKGGFVVAAVRPGESKRPMVSYILGSAVFSLMQAVLLLIILGKAPLGFAGRVWLSVLIGLFVGVASWLPACNWFPYPYSYALPYFLDYIVQGLLAGLIIAKFLPAARSAS